MHILNQRVYLSKIYRAGLFVLVSLGVFSCSSIPKNPKGIENACHIMATDESWHKAFDQTYRKYGVPPHVAMAVIYQESRFVHDAKPPHRKILGIPTGRLSSAYGFPQALDETWEWYQDKTGNNGADRDHLPDAVDFIGWYLNENKKRTGVSQWDAKNQYLAYHEGTGGYLKQTYKKKPWLVKVSEKVARRAAVYRQQLSQCYAFPSL